MSNEAPPPSGTGNHSGSGDTTGPAMITARERETQVLELRKMGANYTEIAAKVGMSRAGAQKAMVRVLNRLKEESVELAEHLRSLELQRLDAMMYGIWKEASSGNVCAIDRVLRIMERRGAYIKGLEMPKKLEHGGMTDSAGNPVGVPVQFVLTPAQADICGDPVSEA